MVVAMTHNQDAVLVNRLSRLMGERRLSIQDVARASGVSYRALFDLYHDRTKRIDLVTLNRLCNYFGVNPNDIFEWTADDPAPTAARAE